MSTLSPANSNLLSRNVAALTALAVGFGACVVTAWMTGKREAWDTPLYLAVVMPAVTAFAGCAGWFRPQRAWLVAPSLLTGQFAALIATNPGGMNLWPLALGLLCVFHAPAFAVAMFGAWLRKRSTNVAQA